MRYVRKHWFIVMVLLVCLIWLTSIVYGWSLPQIIDDEVGDASIHLTVRADLQAPLDNCYQAEWDVQGIAGLYVNDRGKIGKDTDIYCDVDSIEFLVLFQDGTRSVYAVSDFPNLSSDIVPPLTIIAIVSLISIVYFILPDRLIVKGKKVLAVPTLALFGIVMALLVVEVGLRLAFPTQIPQYVNNVYYFEPDEQVGWIHRESFEFTWRGREPKCVEFEGHIRTNQWGFRGGDWTLEKPEDVIRIALVGDSLVEALQMDEDNTAAQMLEKLLSEAYPDRQFEVMNFGVSNFSVGQYQLNYEQNVSNFQPDYVFVLVAYFQMLRNESSYVFLRNETQSLAVRPIYIWNDGGDMELVPPADYKQFEEISMSHPDLINRIDPPFTLAVHKLLNGSLATKHQPLHPEDVEPLPDTIFPQLDINYGILSELAKQVQNDSAKMIFVDIFDYFEYLAEPPGSGVLAKQNEEFALENNVGYIDLSTKLRQSPERVQFPCDQHFTITGNRIFAEAMFDWLEGELDS